MDGAYAYDPELGYMPACQEPFWYRGWRSLFRWRPACYQCGNPMLFKNRSAWNLHYMLKHVPPAPDEVVVPEA